LAIITDLHATALLQSRLLDPLACQLRLLRTKGDAVCLHAIVLRGIDEQPTPTTTDIQQTLPRSQAQLATKILHLVLLCRLQVVIRRSEVGAGVNHARIQPERKKIVGAVVVIVGSLAIALFRVE